MSERKGKGICGAERRERRGNGDEEERKAEKGDERKERRVCGVALLLVTWNSLLPPPMALESPSLSSALSPSTPCPPFDRGSGPVSPRLEAPTVHPRAAN